MTKVKILLVVKSNKLVHKALQRKTKQKKTNNIQNLEIKCYYCFKCTSDQRVAQVVKNAFINLIEHLKIATPC